MMMMMVVVVVEGGDDDDGDGGSDVVSQVDHHGEHLMRRHHITQQLETFRTLPTGGCFGESVFLHSLRPATVIATKPSKG